jgi:hypothetical protein
MLPPCAEYSRQIQEPLIGTISQAHAYFLLEYTAPFGNKALPESTIDPAVFQHLAQIPHSNCVLMRQPHRPADTDGKLTFFAVNVLTATCYELLLDDYADILVLDIRQLLDGNLVAPRQNALYAICTNGKRDECCSRYGVAFYNALQALVGDDVWQCSHIGGHRFAATGIVFPQGVCYGYLDATDAPDLVTHVQNNAIWLDKLRGHIVYTEAVQTADYFLRRQHALTDISAVKLQRVETRDEQTHVMFGANDTSYRVVVKNGALLEVLAGTSDTQLKQTHPFELVGISA